MVAHKKEEFGLLTPFPVLSRVCGLGAACDELVLPRIYVVLQECTRNRYEFITERNTFLVNIDFNKNDQIILSLCNSTVCGTLLLLSFLFK